MTTELIHVRRFKRLGAYRLKLWFTDGQSGNWDFSDLATRAGLMAEPFKDPTYFHRVFLEMGVPTWPNGCDIDPTNARRKLEAAGLLKQQSATV